MSKSTFMMHAGATECTVADLALPRVPAATNTWTPLGHDQVRTGLLKALEAKDLIVVRERWALSDAAKKQPGRDSSHDPDVIHQSGNRCFGLIEIAPIGDDPFGIAMGVRNSLDKTLALQSLVAASVFICDNLVLSTQDENGQRFFRKHTSMIDLDDECRKAALAALAGIDPFRDFISSLREAPCSNDQFNDIICRSIQAKEHVLPRLTANDMLRAWYTGKAPESNKGKTGLDWTGVQQRLDDGFYKMETAWDAHGLWTDLVGRRINPVGSGNDIVDNQAAFNKIITDVCLN